MGSSSRSRRQGAVACGHPATAAAAEEILAEGGNAFDAVLAAFCAACAAEPVLASLGGGGFLLAQPAKDEALLYDFFVQTPMQRRDAQDLDFYPILADFGTATQEFHIGLGAVAVPGAVKGLFAIHGDLASLPLTRLVEPAARLAREGVAIRPIDGYLFEVVAPILKASNECRSLFLKESTALLAEGDRLRQPELANSLEALAAEGADLFYNGELGERLVRLCRESGGLLTPEDLSGYRVEKRRPFACDYRGHRVMTNPPPSSGGMLIAFALELLSGIAPEKLDTTSTEGLARLARVMGLTNKARIEARLEEASDEAAEAAAAERLFDPELLARYRCEVQGQPGFSRGTTHISVVDGEGNLAAMSLSNGEGCGSLLPESGIILNNMLGEEDLNRGGFHRWPTNSRLSSMMAPSLAVSAEGALYAIGSGGSNRIRTAVLQVLVKLLDQGLDVVAATEAPRLHVEDRVANLEGGLPENAAAAMEALGLEAVHWPRHNLFFGGVHGVARSPGGQISAAGDPRRGGAALVIS